MKDPLNLKTSMKEEIESALNNQIKTEAHASSTYLSMSTWCGVHGYDGSADFFAKQAEEERAHMLKLFKYINDRGGRAISPDITNITTDFHSLRDLFEKTLQMEMHVTQLFNDMAEKCISQKDFVTFHFIQWFLEEQVQEEYIARRILDLFDIIGEEGKGCWEIDKQLQKVKYEA
ncbi:ferritin [Gelidibacter japonicus]|uniref:ferritin n=1 Tax=Gelidibacter japonicus TaxID=1962232 RepID=UPI003A8E8C2D